MERELLPAIAALLGGLALWTLALLSFVVPFLFLLLMAALTLVYWIWKGPERGSSTVWAFDRGGGWDQVDRIIRR